MLVGRDRGPAVMVADQAVSAVQCLPAAVSVLARSGLEAMPVPWVRQQSSADI